MNWIWEMRKESWMTPDFWPEKQEGPSFINYGWKDCEWMFEVFCFKTK